jgi:hypothetical protein
MITVKGEERLKMSDQTLFYIVPGFWACKQGSKAMKDDSERMAHEDKNGPLQVIKLAVDTKQNFERHSSFGM